MEKLAIDGGVAVRDRNAKAWPRWPQNSEEEWTRAVEPALRRVYLSSTEGLPGEESGRFGAEFAAHCGARFGVLMPHGTDAISAALAGALDLDSLGDGGEVIVPNYTFVASATAALSVRCSVAFADVDPRTLTLSPEACEAAVVPGRTRALLPVHLGGHPADMESLRAVARRHGLAVVEDCAQAHGARAFGSGVGSLGDSGAYSFQSSKNLTGGEGGIAVTNDEDVVHRIRAFMNVGRRPDGARWEYPRLGWNYRPSEYVAALLRTRLPELDAQIDRRSSNAHYLSQQLRSVPGITPPYVAPWVERHGYHLYCMTYDASQFGGRPRADFLAALSAEGVPCSPGYTQPLSEEGGMRRAAEKYPHLVRAQPCPNVERACATGAWLFQNLLLGTRADMDDIAMAVAKVQRAFANA